MIKFIKRLFVRKPYKLSKIALSAILDSLDETGGFLMKPSELKYWIEKIVNEER